MLPSYRIAARFANIGILALAQAALFWQALEFVRRTSARYDFEAMLTTRYPLDRINEAIQSMRAFREIKPLVLPWTS
jgi:hypothetical protein